MRPELLDEAHEWMTRAEQDLLAASKLLDGAPVLSANAAFHTQQAAEKALKAFLTASGQTFAKTHDLGKLIAACAAIDTGFRNFSQSALILTPYVAEFRYPGSDLEPSEAKAREAIERADEIVTFVRERLVPPGTTDGR